MRLARVMRRGAFGALVLALATLLDVRPASPATSPAPKELTKFERDRARMMLKMLRDDLERFYYDPKFRGLDLDASFKIASERINQAASVSQLFAGIARPLLELRDSHTFFVPPGRSVKVHFGWLMQAIGEDCYVTAVQQGSDAESKGLRPGDRIEAIDGKRPARGTIWGINYVYRTIAPRPDIALIARGPRADEARTINVKARLEQQKQLLDLTRSSDVEDFIHDLDEEAHLGRHRLVTYGPALGVWRMPSFNLTPSEVTNFMRDVLDHKALVLDLRGNGGGSVETLERMVGAIAGEGKKIGDVKSREEMKPIVSKKAGDVYDGKVFVLIDSDSGSASELFARMIQLSGRGKVIGDRSSGSVMMSRTYPHMVGDSSGIQFYSSITVADIIMTDGKSLENHGVVPDTVMLPSAEDLATGRDPVLAHAIGLAGVEVSPAQAAELFPIEWKK
jgi:carboxyl-terminal processing protease